MRRVVLYVLGYIFVFGTYLTYTQYNPTPFQAPVLDQIAYSDAFHAVESNDQTSYRWLFRPLQLTIPAVTTQFRTVSVNGVSVHDVNMVEFHIAEAPPVSIPIQGGSFRVYEVLLRDHTTTSGLQPTIQLTITPQHFQIVDNRLIGIAIHSLEVTALQPTLLPPLWVWYAVWGMLAIVVLYSLMIAHTTEHSFWFIVCIGICSIAAIQLISLTTAIVACVSMMILYSIYRYASPIYNQLVHGVPHTFTTTYRSDIDGLRALAVVAVVVYHAFPEWLPGGFIGVDIFFVISGYLITRIIMEEVATKRFSIRHFYVRRIRRIFPALLTILLATAFIGMFLLYQSEYVALGTQILAGTGFVSNIVLYQQVDYFGDLAVNQPLLHLWSLGVEEQFYIVWPIILWLMTKNSRLLVPSIIVLLVSSFLININTIPYDSAAAFYLLPSRFWQLGVGGIIAIYTLFQRSPTPPRVRYQPVIMPLIGVILYGYGIFAFDESMAFPGWYAVIPTVSGGLLVLPHAANWISHRFLSHPVCVWIGKISFPLYLWHWPILTFGFMTLDSGFTPMLKLIALGFSVILATITYWYIENPVRFSHAKLVPTASLVVVMVGVSGIGWLIQNRHIPSFIPDFTTLQVRQMITPQSCNEIFGLTMNISDDSSKICTMRTGATTQSEYVVIGDSHARIFTSGLLATTSHQVMLYSNSGCMPLLGMDRLALRCKENNPIGEVFQYLAQHPTIHTHRYVVLVGRYALIEPTSLNINARANPTLQVDGIPPEETKAHPEKVIEVGLHQSLTALTGLPNTTVILFHQVPELQYSPKNFARLVTILDTANTSAVNRIFQTPRSAVTQHFQRYKRAVQQVLVDFPDVQEFTADDLFCDNTTCLSSIDGKLAYLDHHHLNLWGATRVAQVFVRTFP